MEDYCYYIVSLWLSLSLSLPLSLSLSLSLPLPPLIYCSSFFSSFPRFFHTLISPPSLSALFSLTRIVSLFFISLLSFPPIVFPPSLLCCMSVLPPSPLSIVCSLVLALFPPSSLHLYLFLSLFLFLLSSFFRGRAP